MKSTFISFVVKEWRHILRERLTLVMLFVIPLLLVLLFGYVISTDINNTSTAVFDRSNGDPAARALIHRFGSSGQFRIVRGIGNEKEIMEAFREGRVRLVVVIPERFGADLYRPGGATVQLIADASDLNVSTTITGYAAAIINDYAASLSSARGAAAAPPLQVDVRMMYNPELRSAYMFIPGVIALIVMIVSAMMTSITLVREKEKGTLRLLLVSPLKPRTIVLGKVVPYFLLSLVNTAMIVGLGMLVFKVPCHGSLWSVLLVCSLFILSAIGLGILISSLVRTQQTALMSSLLGLFLPTILLSGFVFPVSSMPAVLQWVSQVVPATWFIEGLKALMLKGVGIEMISIQLVVLGGMTVVFIGGALALFHKNTKPRK